MGLYLSCINKYKALNEIVEEDVFYISVIEALNRILISYYVDVKEDVSFINKYKVLNKIVASYYVDVKENISFINKYKALNRIDIFYYIIESLKTYFINLFIFNKVKREEIIKYIKN